MTERLFCHEFATSKSEASNLEAKSEIEVADFDRLLSKIQDVQMNSKLRDLLMKIKDSGVTKSSLLAASGGHILTRKRSTFSFIWPSSVTTSSKASSEASSEFGYMTNKLNNMDNIVLVHSFRQLSFKDEFFDDKEFEILELKIRDLVEMIYVKM